MNWKDSTGAWQRIDTTLSKRGDARVHNGSGPVDISFPTTAGSSDVVTLTAGSSAVGFGAPDGAASVTPTVSASTVTYRGILPSADLQYQLSAANSVKEEVILKTPPPAGQDVTYRFPLRLSAGLVPRQDVDGGVGIYDAGGTEQYRVPPGTMMDSRLDPHLGQGASAPVQLSLDTSGGTPVVVIHADGVWLRDPARVYPVNIDPSVWRAGYDGHWAGDTFASNRCGGCNYDVVWNSTLNRYEDDLGYYNGNTGTNRTYLEYDLGSAYGKRIISATWNGYFMWNYWVSASTQYWIHPVAASSAWSPGGLTWNNQDGVAPRRGDTIVDSAARYQWRSVGMTGWVQNWANHTWPNSGIELDEGSHEVDPTYWKQLASSNNGDGSQSHIDITYEGYGASYGFQNSEIDPPSPSSNPSFRGPAPNTATNMWVYVTNNGTDAWPTNGIYRLTYHVYDRNNTSLGYDGPRTYMPQQVNPGQGIWLYANIGPLAANSYTLRWDMVEEGVVWFSNWGVPTAPFRIDVGGVPVAQSPADQTILDPNRPTATVTLQAGASSGAALYRFDIGTASDFSSIAATSGWLGGTSWQLPAGTLQTGQQYFWRVVAADSAQTTTQFSATNRLAVFARPSAPTTVTASGGSGQAAVSWTAPAAPQGTSITGYVVTPYQGATALAPVSSATTAVTVPSLTNGASYSFVVQAQNSAGTGASSTPSPSVMPAGPPAAPSAVSALAGYQQATVSWTAPPPSGADVTSYTVTPYVGPTAQTPVNVTAPASSATISGLSNGTAYTFMVTVTNSLGTSPPSTATSAITPGPAPTVSLTTDAPAAGIYSRGSTVTYTATVGAGGGTTLSNVGLTAALPPTVSAIGTTIMVNGTPCSGTTCSATAGSISVSPLTVTASSPAVVTFTATAIGIDRQCSAQAVSVSAISNGLGGSVSAPATVCDTGLGSQKWWSAVGTATGDGGSLSVNPADGNVEVHQPDITSIQLHGSLSLDLQRSYNSQDSLLNATGPFGEGWTFSAVGSPDGVGGGALAIPPAEAFDHSLPVTLITDTGSRQVFTPRAPSSVVDVTGLAPSSPLATLVPTTLAVDAGYSHLCVDQTFSSPPGIHLSLWRYVETTNATCTGLNAANTTVLGYASITTNRIRREFAWHGDLLSIRDASGNEVDYGYEHPAIANGSLGNLTSIKEKGSARGFTFNKSTYQTDVTDPAGRKTQYKFDPAAPTHLITVVNPDNSTLQYAYGGCGGSSDQLCAMADALGHSVALTYTAAPLGPARVHTIADRQGTSTTVSYSSSPDRVLVDTGTERRRFQAIDTSGRVGEIDEGSTSDTYLHVTYDTWDTPGTTCRQPDQAVDNNLCAIDRLPLNNGVTPTRHTTEVYSDEGAIVVQTDADSPTALATSTGYQDQYLEAGGSVNVYTDTVRGQGAVTSTGPQSGSRSDAGTVFILADNTQLLSPRGNAAGTGYSPYLTTYKIDALTTAAAGVRPAVGACASPGSPSSNSGALCETDSPSVDGVQPASVAVSTYDTYGQRVTSTRPLAVQKGWPATTYTYYQDGDAPMAGSTSPGGWLKATADPTGNFVAFGYDAAGNVTRTWDRNATHGMQLAAFPGTVSSPPTPAYTDTVHGSYTSPWRYVTSRRDAVGDTTTSTPDANGNILGSRPPRGTAANTNTYDIVATYNANDQQLTMQTPVEAASNTPPTTYGYDAYGNKTSVTEPNGVVTSYTFDSVNRQTGSSFTRGTGTAPAGCRQSGSGDTPIPSGRILCSTSTAYDGVDNVVGTTDAAGQSTSYVYDAAHRKVSTVSPRNDGVYNTVRTDTVFDADGNVTDVCPPRQFTDGGSSSCSPTATNVYSVRDTYSPRGQLLSTTSYKDTTPTSVTTAYGYDGDGNRTSVTDANGHATSALYDMLDRKTQQTAPRDSSNAYTTTYNYDASGNTMAITRPASITNGITAYSYDAANRPIDTVAAATNPAVNQDGQPDPLNQLNLRTRKVYDADGHVVQTYQPQAFATGTVSSPSPLFMTETAYDVDGRPITQYSPRYDDSTAFSTSSSTSYAASQEAQCRTGAPNYGSTTGVCTTTISYDAVGNISKVVLPTSMTSGDNRHVSYSYTDDHLLATVSAPSPQNDGSQVSAKTTAYDADGRVIATTDANGNAMTTDYYADSLVAHDRGQPNSTVTHVTTSMYDANGNLVQTTDPVGNASTVTYTPNNWKVGSTDGAGDLTSYVLDGVGNPVRVLSPSANAHDPNNTFGWSTINTYSSDNLLTSSTVPIAGGLERQTAYTYDAAGRKASQHTFLVTGAETGSPAPVTGDDGGTQSFSYFPNDLSQAETARDGKTSTKGYNANGDLTKVTDASTTPNSALTATYYLDGRPRTVDDGSQTTQYSYDGSGSVATRTQIGDTASSGSSVAIAYGDAGLAAKVYSDAIGPAVGASVTRTYDPAGRPASQTDTNGQVTTWGFNPDNTLGSITLKQGGSNGSATLSTWTYASDGDMRMASATMSGATAAPGGTQTQSFSYLYDAASRLRQVTYNGSSQTITYNHDGARLSYAPLNGTPAATYTYNADDSIYSTTTGGTPLVSTYDYAGRLSNDQCSTFQYDGFDRKVQATSISGRPSACGLTPLTTSTYAYDGLDRQRSMNTGTGATTIHFDGLSSHVVDDTLPTGTDTFYALNEAGHPMAVASGSTKEWLVHDGTGSVAMTTSSTDTVNCTVPYDPNGGPLTPPSAMNPCNSGSTVSQLLFHDGQWDSSTGQYQLGARTYDPSKAAYLTPDHYRASPARQDVSVGVDPLTLNRYGYVNGDPVNLRDPDGHHPAYDGSPEDQQAQSAQFVASQYAGTPIAQHMNDLAAQAAARAQQANAAAAASAARQAAAAAKQAAAAQQARAATAHLIDANGPRTVDAGAGTGLGSNIDVMTGKCVNCSGTRAVAGRTYMYNSGMQTWVCGDRDARGTNCGEGATYRFNQRSNGVEQYDDGARTVMGWLGDHKVDIAMTALMVGVQFIPGVDVAADAIASARLAEGAAEGATALAEREGVSLAERCAVNSFTAATPVLMATGLEKAISDVKVGDVVKAGDAQKDATTAEAVQRVIVGHGVKHLVDVQVAGETIEATYNHPFWVVDDQKFEWANQLKPGEHLWLSDGSTAVVEALHIHDATTSVYNLSIANVHTFFVGTVPVLVHNSCAPILRGRAPEYRGGTISEGSAMDAASEWLGEGYSEVQPGRYISENGARGVRYGTHETRGATQHIHFEAYEGGRVIENTWAEIIP